MWQSAMDTANGAVELCMYLDEDDLKLPEYRVPRSAETGGHWNLNITIGPRILLSEAWNVAAEKATGDIWMHAGDDIIFRTPGWDKAVADAFPPDGIAFVYGRDGYQDENLGTHGFVTRRWVDAVGYFMPPYFSSDYNDLWLHEVAGMIDRRVYLPDVLIEHMHPIAGKGEWDRTHRDRLARHNMDRPDLLYERLAPQRAADAEKLRAVCA